MADDDAKTWREFRDTVNMTASDLEKWLGTEVSNRVGQKNGDNKSVGHASGRRIVEILRSKRTDLFDDDYCHMRKVIGYARRHLAQRPAGDVSESAWRFSLMNWGHDPCR